jgi:NADPH-dependent 2,4-dienoyl-CoA reductase/sulfur reductase-like enzyme
MRNAMQTYRYVILGGGIVAGYAARELVEGGLGSGELAIVSTDGSPPYERPPLSKGFLAGTEERGDLFINGCDYYAGHGIDLRLNAYVTALDLRRRLLHTATDEEIGYEKLLIATGARVRWLDIPGARAAGVHYLRTLDDAERLRTAAASATRAVVLGGGFIGLETAATLRGRGLEVTLVVSGARVWERLFTPPISDSFERYFAERGVRIVKRARAIAIEGWDRAAAVVLSDGRRLPADLVVAGVGVLPATEALEGSGLALDDGVLVDEYLETSEADVYAAGDVARYQDVLFETRRRVEHWDNAVEQGRHAARALLGQRAPFVHVPYFFSDIFDRSYEVWGDPAGADDVVYRGDVPGGRFSVWWLRAGRLVAAFVMDRPDAERELAAAWIAERRPVSAAELGDERAPLQAVFA